MGGVYSLPPGPLLGPPRGTSLLSPPEGKISDIPGSPLVGGGGGSLPVPPFPSRAETVGGSPENPSLGLHHSWFSGISCKVFPYVTVPLPSYAGYRIPRSAR